MDQKSIKKIAETVGNILEPRLENLLLPKLEQLIDIKLLPLQKRMEEGFKENKLEFFNLYRVLGVFFKEAATKDDLNNLRIEMEEQIDGKFDSLQYQINSLKGAMQTGFDQVDERFNLLEVAVKKILPDHEQRIQKVEKAIFP